MSLYKKSMSHEQIVGRVASGQARGGASLIIEKTTGKYRFTVNQILSYSEYLSWFNNAGAVSPGDKLFIKDAKTGSNAYFYFYNQYTDGNRDWIVLNSDQIITVHNGGLSSGLFVVDAGTAVGTCTGYVQIFNLTKMYGAGSEPTLAQCKEIFDMPFYPYNILD